MLSEVNNWGTVLKSTAFGSNQNTIEFDLSVTRPLPELVKDTDEVSNLINQYRLLPKFRYGNCSALNLLKLIERICNQSPTHGSCLHAVHNFAFGGDIDAKKSTIPAFKLERIPISEADKLKFAQDVTSLGISFIDFKRLTAIADRNYVESGDAYLYCKVIRVGSVFKVSFNSIAYTELMFWLDGDKDYSGNPITAIWCKNFASHEMMNNGKYAIVNVTPIGSPVVNWSQLNSNDKNVFETVFHVKNGDNTDLYGKVGIERILTSIFSEYQQGEFAVKVDNSALTAKYIYSTPAPPDGLDPQIANDNFLQSKTEFNKIATTKGKNPDEIAFQEYYAQDGTPLLFKLDVSRDSAWFKGKSEWAKQRITGFHNVNDAFLGMSQYAQGIGSDAEINNLLKTNVSTIRPKQDFWESIWSYIFNAVSDKTGIQSLKDNTIEFEDKTKGIIESIVQSRGTTAKINQTNGTSANVTQ
jgi:hypothetical protein